MVFGALTQNRSSLEPSLGFAATAGTPRMENGGTFAVDSADGHDIDVRPGAPQTFRGPLRTVNFEASQRRLTSDADFREARARGRQARQMRSAAAGFTQSRRAVSRTGVCRREDR